jgi:translation initiation factor 1
MLEPFDQAAEVALELGSALERLEQFAIADRGGLGCARLGEPRPSGSPAAQAGVGLPARVPQDRIPATRARPIATRHTGRCRPDLAYRRAVGMDLTPTGPELLRQDPHQFPRRAGSVRTVKRDARIVYSTTDGDLPKPRDPLLKQRRADGDRVTVRREVAARRGKPVTTAPSVPVDDAGLKALAGKLKKRCGVGGSVKAGEIEIHGDHREVVVEILKAEGYTPVLAGG